MDRISTLPEHILETILCLLSTKAAARTSILSREWRYKWTRISKLDFVVPLRIPNDMMCKPFHDLHQVLLLHQGIIHDLSLLMSDQSTTGQDSVGFDQVLLHLSKNHKLKKLRLSGFSDSSWLNLPTSIFSLHHLTDLDIYGFNLNHQPIFSGFGSLRSLSLIHVGISTKTLLHLLSKCPSLKSLILSTGESHLGVEDCTVVELFKCLPMIENLTMTTIGDVFTWLVLGSVPRKLPTLLYHLKYFCFQETHTSDGYGLAFLHVLIKCSPNLEKIKIRRHRTCYENYPVVWEELSDVWLEHLNEFQIQCFRYSKSEMDFVKFILARSPNLKNVTIHSSVPQVLKTLLQAPRASVVEITFVKNYYEDF